MPFVEGNQTTREKDIDTFSNYVIFRCNIHAFLKLINELRELAYKMFDEVKKWLKLNLEKVALSLARTLYLIRRKNLIEFSFMILGSWFSKRLLHTARVVMLSV